MLYARTYIKLNLKTDYCTQKRLWNQKPQCESWFHYLLAGFKENYFTSLSLFSQKGKEQNLKK